MSLTLVQRAQILHLHRVEGVSVTLIAAMTGYSRFAVMAVLRRAHGQGVPATEKAAARVPLWRGPIERQMHRARVGLRRKGAS